MNGCCNANISNGSNDKMMSKVQIEAIVFNVPKFSILISAVEASDGNLQWAAKGGIKCSIAPSNTDNIRLFNFLAFTCDNLPESSYATLIDAHDDQNELDQQFIKHMQVRYEKWSHDDNFINEINLEFTINTQFVPYNEDEYTTVDRWFKESAIMLANKVITEVAVRAGVPAVPLLINKDDDDARVASSKYRRFVKCSKGESPNVIVEISFCEHPEFYIEDVMMAIIPNSDKLYNKLKVLDANCGHILVDNLPVCLYEVQRNFLRERPDMPFNTDILQGRGDKLMWVYIGDINYYQPKMFLMNRSRSANYIQHVRNLAMPVVANCSQDEIPSVMGSIAVRIAEHIGSLLKED